MDVSSLSVGDVVQFETKQWTVIQILELEEQRDLLLERPHQVKASTPYGQPQRYKSQPLKKRVNAQRVELVASQSAMF